MYWQNELKKVKVIKLQSWISCQAALGTDGKCNCVPKLELFEKSIFLEWLALKLAHGLGMLSFDLNLLQRNQEKLETRGIGWIAHAWVSSCVLQTGNTVFVFILVLI